MEVKEPSAKTPSVLMGFSLVGEHVVEHSEGGVVIVGKVADCSWKLAVNRWSWLTCARL